METSSVNNTEPQQTHQSLSKKIGKHLRATHYKLGVDGWDPESEYQREYVAKKGSYNKKGDPNSKDQSVFLRSSQFMLGNTPVNYQTSSQAQNESIPNDGKYHNNRLTDETKQRLRRSQFSLGTSKNDFSTDYNMEYYDKSSLNKIGNVNESKIIKEKLRSSNYEIGSDKPNYISENAGQFTKPVLNYEEIKKTKMQTDENTKNLRSQHFDFGQEKVPWKSINREVFTPKKLDNNRYNSKLNELIRRGNIQKPEENRDFTSETMLSYSKKPLVDNSLSKEYKENLRKNHFDFGDNNFKENANTVNREDFKDPRLNKNYNYGREILDPYKFRKSQWSLAPQNGENYFNTTYSRTMTPKKLRKEDISNNANLHTSIQIGDNKLNKEDYKSVYDANYGNQNLMDGNYYINNSDKKIFDNIKKFNKNSHFELLQGKGDYNTTMNEYYKYNINEAKSAFNPLNEQARINLRGTHYQLGLDNEMEKETSNKRDYIAYAPIKMERITSGKRNYESMGKDPNGNIFDANTIYQTDYTKKPMPKEDENIDMYLYNKYTKANQ